MMRRGYSILMAVTGVLLSGCPKHNNAGMSQMPVVPAEQKNVAAAKSDEAFNKYYVKATDAAAHHETITATFSMRKPETAPAKKPETTALVAATVPEKKPVVQEAKPNQVVRASPTSFSANWQFAVQVASTPSNGDAEAIASKFKTMGYAAYVLEVKNPRSDLEGTYYRVRIGSFATEDNAKSFGETVVLPEHFDYWVVNKSDEKFAGAQKGAGMPDSVAGEK